MDLLSKNLDKYRVIAFDIDGTLYHSKIMFKVLLLCFLRHPRLSLCIKKFRDEERKNNVKEINNYYDREILFFKKYFKLGTLEEGKALVKVFMDYKRKVFNKYLVPFDGVESTFKELKRRGKDIYLLSDFPIDNKLELLKIKKYVSGAYFSGDSNRLKPDKIAFEYLLNKANCTKDEILYIGDSISKDIDGALNIKIDALLFKRGKTKIKNSFNSYIGE